MTVSIYVCGISAQVSRKQIIEHFSQVGPVENYIPKFKNGVFTGYGFIDYETQEQADAAVAQLDHTYLPGVPNRYLKVNYASKEESTDQSITQNKIAGKARPAAEDDFKLNFDMELVPKELHMTLRSLDAQSVYDILLAMRYYAIKHPKDARSLLTENPQLAHCLAACLSAYGEISQEEINSTV